MIAARHLARSLEQHGRPDLKSAVRLVAAGANPYRIAERYHLSPAEVRSLPTLAEAVREAASDA